MGPARGPGSILAPQKPLRARLVCPYPSHAVDPAVERGLITEVENAMSRRTISLLAALPILLLAACGGGGGGDGDAGADNPTTATIESGSEPAAVPLAPGRYRLTITEDCDDYTVEITQEGGDFTYEISNSPIRIVFVNDLPGGNFLIQQTNPDCTDWTLDMSRVSSGN
jgi:hypothetical protein